METKIRKSRLRKAGKQHSLPRQIGETPLLSLDRVTESVSQGVSIYAKAEWMNASGSVKARPALAMILKAIDSGKLTPDRCILDATSGNTGIAYATIGNALGYEVALTLPSNATVERKATLNALGVEIIFTDPTEKMDGAIQKARELADNHPDRYVYMDQYNNPLNWQSHYLTTGPEIHEQTDGEVTHFVAGLGTSGTFIGSARYLREEMPDVKVISFEPETVLHGLEGLKHMETSVVPGLYDDSVASRNIGIGTEDAYEMMWTLAEEEGIFVGPSGAAAVCASLTVAKDLSSGTIVTILPDSGERYMDLWTEDSTLS